MLMNTRCPADRAGTVAVGLAPLTITVNRSVIATDTFQEELVTV
jgi:hypothetical protein